MAGFTSKLTSFDREHSRAGKLTLAGVDEAGRGAWAGPVVAAAVILPPDLEIVGLDDSKKLTPARRDVLFAEIMTSASAWGACAVSPQRIDIINILQASLEAMVRSVAKLRPAPELVLIDGDKIPVCPWSCLAIVKGDGKSASIASASILAKVLRDRIMCTYGDHFPGYGFVANKGYGVEGHRQALQELGPSPIHRLSYRPLVELDQGRLF